MQRILVTGASRGLGLELVRQGLARGDRVFAGARTPTPELLALRGPRLTIAPLDVADPAAIAACRDAVAAETDALDLLVNNAGIHSGSPDVRPEHRNLAFGALEPEGILQMVRVNAVGPALVAQAFAPLLARGRRPRVVNVSSRRGALSAKTDGGNYAYCASKAALNMIGRALAADLGALGVTSVLVHPGLVRTRMAMADADLEPAESVAALLALADRLVPADAGRFFRWDGSEHPW